MTEILNKLKRGDMLTITGEDDNGKKETWLAEYYDKDKKQKDHIVINYIEEDLDDPPFLKYNTRDHFDTCHIDCVDDYASSSVGFSNQWKHEREGYAAACKKLGYRMLSKDKFIKEEDYDSSKHDIGEFDGFTDDSSDDESEDEDDKNFIVATSDLTEEEDFSEGNSDEDEFIRDTHKAVREYENWEPTNKKQKKVKKFIDDLTDKIIKQEDEKRFQQGRPSLSIKK